MEVDLPEADDLIQIYVGILAETPAITGFDYCRRTHVYSLLKAMRYTFVLHQHSKSPRLSGLGPTQRFKRSLKLPCSHHAHPGFDPLTFISEVQCSNH